MNRFRLTVILLVLALFAAVPAFAHQETPQNTIELSADGLVVPAELPAGITTISFINSSEAPFGPVLARLNEGVTLDAMMEAMSQTPEAILPMITLLGGTQVAPGATFDITFDLKPGDHVAVNFAGEIPDVKPFTVVDSAAAVAAAPEADVQVSLLDFAFSLSTTLKAGEQTWLLENKGQQWHEMAVVKIDPEMTVGELQDIVHKFASGEADPSTLPVEQVAMWFPMQQGERAWFNLNLEPGSYVIACFLPDFGSGHAHVDLGMVQVITVTE